MRAVVMHEFGPPSVLVAGDVSDPAPGPHQVVVHVEAANITFVDTQVRAGRPPNPSMLPHYLPSWGTAWAAWSPGSVSRLIPN